MLQQHLWRIVQSIVALVLLILTIVYWKGNHLGQNLINFESVFVWAIGLQNIVIPFRWVTNKQTFEYEISLLLFCMYVIGKLFQTYNPNHIHLEFNIYCRYNILVPLAINLAFIVLMMVVILLYSLRHIYRLISDTLLSSDVNLQPEQLNRIMELRKPFQEIDQEHPDISRTCSICLMDFQPDCEAILLPVCQHIYHQECIQNWLQTKATCPYCRNNIRLSLI